MNNQHYDNLFCANHRAEMQAKYGATEAEFVTIEQVINYAKQHNV